MNKATKITIFAAGVFVGVVVTREYYLDRLDDARSRREAHSHKTRLRYLQERDCPECVARDKYRFEKLIETSY